MATSNIEAIYSALAATTLTVDNRAIAVKSLDTLPKKLDTADLPCRVLSPLVQVQPIPASYNASSVNVWAAGGINVIEVNWQVTDNLYWEAIGQTEGVRANAGSLVRYMSAYLAMVADTSALILPSSVRITNVQLSAQMIEYPLLSGQWYYGVSALLSVSEKYS